MIPTCTILLLKPSASLLAVRALQCLKLGFLFHISKAGLCCLGIIQLTLVFAFQFASARGAPAPAAGRFKKKEVRLDHRSGGERAPQHKNQIRCLALTAAPTHRLCCSMGEVLLEGHILNRDASYCDNMFLTNCLSSLSLVVRPPLLSSSDQDHN